MILVDFTVRIQTNLNPKEKIYITGNTHSLGNWSPSDAICLSCPSTESQLIWNTPIFVEQNSLLQYRYFIADEQITTIISWEAGPRPREVQISDEDNIYLPIEEYGLLESGYSCLDKGWLMDCSEVRLNLYDTPVKLLEPNSSSHYGIKVSYTYGDSNDDVQVYKLSDKHNLVDTCSIENDDSFEVNCAQNCELFSPDDYIVCKTQTTNIDSLGLNIDIYNDVQTKVGTAIILLSHTKNSHGKCLLPIMCIEREQLKCVGDICVVYTIIKPMENCSSMKESFANQWTKRSGPISVGHRGLGITFFNDDDYIRENTILSFNSAVKEGADFIEFDVHLSKDGIPFVYHDFFLRLTHGHKDVSCDDVIIDTALCDLTMKQLNDIKSTNKCNINQSLNTSKTTKLPAPAVNNRPFPLLRDCFKEVDPYAGFFIELKYPNFLHNGKLEDDYKNAFDMNYFVDQLLIEILNNAGSRRVIIACFNPDICLMLRLKQNKYPVIFLCQGLNKVYPHYKDPRARGLDLSFSFASIEKFLGVAPFCDELLDNVSMVDKAKQMGHVVFSWGETITNRDEYDKLKHIGIDAIICDRIQHISDRENIFKMESITNI